MQGETRGRSPVGEGSDTSAVDRLKGRTRKLNYPIVCSLLRWAKEDIGSRFLEACSFVIGANDTPVRP